ncbi:MAG: multicopper oxidase domain-containing protein, partial [Deltaproteobacteria bacterium]|nr:multicopper oxidase domain-containing protein [Deltaproteobacteria bacterium]
MERHAAPGRRIRKTIYYFTYYFIGAALCGFLNVSIAPATELDDFGPPPEGDPSAQTGPFIGLQFADNALRGVPPANEGALILQDNVQGTVESVGVNIVPPPRPRDGIFNIPTNSKPSPLFGAQSFTQQMLLFEEFGPEALNDNTPLQTGTFPMPVDNQSGPVGTALETFLAGAGIGPYPTRVSNTVDLNPWKTAIESFLGRPILAPPAEGRPPGEGWAHQRWNEFKPQSFFKTAQAGARTNGGFRDGKQRHQYSAGEFGPGGLYHTVYGTNDNAAILVGSTAGLEIRFHPNMPIQDPKALWTFDGTLPPKLLMARHGQPIMMRHYNALPIDPTANRGFGLHTITTHEHNGHSPAESDGYTNAFFFPGQFYDYRWPLQLAGYDSINTDATDPRAAFPCSPEETLFVNDSADNTVTPKTCVNGSIRIRGDWHETMSTHWFHDHMLDFTAQNVYKGNAVMMNYYSALDRGNETFSDGINLRLPSGTALPWGNRDYDVNLVIADKAWDQSGQLWFNIFNTDGFLGDHLFANWLYHPYFEVRARRYRFRILNGSVSRYLSIALVRQRNDTDGELPGPGGSGISYDRVPFHMIANDGNIMEHAVPFDGNMDLDGDGIGVPDDFKGILPTQGIAERYDIVVDFKRHGIQPGDRLYFVNVLEHRDGRGVSGKIPLGNILSGNYQARLRDNNNDGVPDEWEQGDPAVGKFLEFRVVAHSGGDPSMNPDDFIPGRQTMIPLLIHSEPDGKLPSALENVRHRTFEFGRSEGTDATPWTIKTDDGVPYPGAPSPLPPALGFHMDPRRVSAAPQLATGPTQGGFSGGVPWEVWTIKGGGGWDHPVHVHFEEGIILSRGGDPPPEWEKWARKDMYRIGDNDDSRSPIVMAIRFREFAGTYVEHCHNTQHEDRAMLLRWDVEHPGQYTMMPTPLPTWDGVEFVDSAPFEYEFQRRFQRGAFATVQAFGAVDNLVWSTSGFAPGAYEVKVAVRPVGRTTLLGIATIPYTLASGAATGVNLTPSPSDPQAPGTSVTWTASASGGSGSYEYEFWLL